MAGFFGAPSAVRLRLSGRAVDRSLALQLACQQLFPVLRQAFEDRWATTHAAWCGCVCASSILLDGNEKLVPHGCCFAERGLDGRTAFCCAAGTSPAALQSIVRRRSICCRFMLPACATAGGRGAAFFRRLLFVVVFLSGGIHTHLGCGRWQPRAARTPPAQVRAPEAADCNTCKARSVRACQRGGILCATFGCGIVMPPQRFHVAESLPQVAAYVEHLLRINPGVAAAPLLPVISKAPGTPTVCSSPLPTLLDPASGVVPASGDAAASVRFPGDSRNLTAAPPAGSAGSKRLPAAARIWTTYASSLLLFGSGPELSLMPCIVDQRVLQPSGCGRRGCSWK